MYPDSFADQIKITRTEPEAFSLISYIKVAKERHLITLWISQVFSAIGDELYSIASVWIATQIGGPKAGFVAASGQLSGMVIGLLAGVLADRWNRRTTMIVVDVLRAFVAVCLALTAHFMSLQLWHLGLASALIAMLSTFFEPSLQASIPELTKASGTLNSMNALMITNSRMARAIGPGLAGFLVAALPIHHFFSLDAVTFLVSALAITSISRHYAWKIPNVSGDKISPTRVFREVAAAGKLLLAHTELKWTFAIYFVSIPPWAAAYIIGFPLWIKQLPEGNIGMYGILLACYGMGGVLSNVLVGMLKTKRRMLFVSLAQMTYCVGFLVIAYTNDFAVACISAAFAATGGPVSDILLVTMMQSEMPAASLGRIFSFRSFLFSLAGSIGLLLAPLIFTTFNPRTGVAICALGIGVAGLVGLTGLAPEFQLLTKQLKPGADS